MRFDLQFSSKFLVHFGRKGKENYETWKVYINGIEIEVSLERRKCKRLAKNRIVSEFNYRHIDFCSENFRMHGFSEHKD